MRVIGHQAITQQPELVKLHVLAQPGELDQAVGVAVENIAARISTLRHVVKNPNRDHSC
jgi:hypothetical protein